MSDDPMVREWLMLLELTTDYMTAAEKLIDMFRGKMNTRQTLDEALPEIAQAVDAYHAARRSLIEYAQQRQRVMA
jgi:hypothetical protein